MEGEFKTWNLENGETTKVLIQEGDEPVVVDFPVDGLVQDVEYSEDVKGN